MKSSYLSSESLTYTLTTASLLSNLIAQAFSLSSGSPYCSFPFNLSLEISHPFNDGGMYLTYVLICNSFPYFKASFLKCSNTFPSLGFFFRILISEIFLKTQFLNILCTLPFKLCLALTEGIVSASLPLNLEFLSLTSLTSSIEATYGGFRKSNGNFRVPSVFSLNNAF